MFTFGLFHTKYPFKDPMIDGPAGNSKSSNNLFCCTSFDFSSKKVSEGFPLCSWKESNSDILCSCQCFVLNLKKSNGRRTCATYCVHLRHNYLYFHIVARRFYLQSGSVTGDLVVSATSSYDRYHSTKICARNSKTLLNRTSVPTHSF